MAKQHTFETSIFLGRRPIKDWLSGNVAGLRRVALAWAAATVYASCLILAFINTRSVWLDESVSVAVASQPVSGIAQILRHVDAVHGLYYFILHLWLFLGHGAIVVRLLSAVFALLATVEIATLGALMFEEALAPAAVAILATSAFFLYYADEARPAALGLLACSVTALRFWRVVKFERTRDILLCGFFAVVSVYANVVALVFLAGLVASLGFVRLERRSLLLLAGTALAGGLALIPLAAGIRADTLVQVSWIVRGTPRTELTFVLGLLGAFGGGGHVSHLAGLLAAATVGGLMLLGLLYGWQAPEKRASLLATVTWLVLPLVLAVGVDQWIQPILIQRYFPFELVPVALLAGNGLLAAWRMFRPATALVLVAALACISLDSLATTQREDWRSVVRLLAGAEQPGDAVVLWAPIVMTPFEFAVHERAPREPARVLYPSGPLRDEVDFPKPKPGFAQATSRRYRRVWFIDSHDLEPRGTNPLAGFARYYPNAHQRTFPGIEVTLYSR